ncbi:hypothetical protein E4K10_11905 [Streptomyces sp. T1317-0309]|nr:hypothetical protein E4K10_11905 [Streptomyces sp. T1317-0309]
MTEPCGAPVRNFPDGGAVLRAPRRRAAASVPPGDGARTQPAADEMGAGPFRRWQGGHDVAKALDGPGAAYRRRGV